MGDFGFDPSIIMHNSDLMQRQPTLGELIQSTRTKQLEQQMLQAHIDELRYNQGRQRTLADLVSGGVSPDQAYQRIGDPRGMMDAQEAALRRQMDQDNYMKAHTAILQTQVNTLKTPEDVDRWSASQPQWVRDAHNVPGPDATPEKKLAWTKSFAESGMAPDKRAEYEEAQRQRTAANDPNSPVSQMYGQAAKAFGLNAPPGTPANAYDDKVLGYMERLKGINALWAYKLAAAGARAAPTEAPPANSTSLDKEAQHFLATGTFILPGRSRDALAHNRQVMERAFQMNPDADTAGVSASYKADAGSLHHAQTQADAVNSFTRTFDKNSAILEDALGKLDSSSTPIINKGYRAWQGATGDPNLTAFNNALNTVRSELGKINSGSTGQGGVPITLLQEMESGLPANATPAQVLSALKTYRQDSENRRAAMQDQINEIKGRLSAKKGGGGAVAPSAAGGGAAPAPHGDRVKQGGVWFKWNGSDYEPEASASAKP